MEENKNLLTKPTEEQLKYWLDKAISDNKNLVSRLRETTNAINALPFLFKVIELRKEFEEEFVKDCKEAIKNILFACSEDKEEELLTKEEDKNIE